MVLKPTAISYVFLSSGIALIFWNDGPVLCQFGHTLSSSCVNYLEMATSLAASVTDDEHGKNW